MGAEGIGAETYVGLGDLAVHLVVAVGVGQKGVIGSIDKVAVFTDGMPVLLENSLPVRFGYGIELVGGQGIGGSLGEGLVAHDACAAGDEGDGQGTGRNEDQSDRNHGYDAFFGHGKFSFLLIFE